VASKKRQRVVDDDDNDDNDDDNTTGSVISGPSHASLLPLPYHREPPISAAMDMFLLHGAGSSSGSGAGSGSGSAGIISSPGTDYKQALQQLKRHARGANYEEAKNDLLRFAHSVETAGTPDALAALTGFFLDEPLPWDPQVRVRGGMFKQAFAFFFAWNVCCLLFAVCCYAGYEQHAGFTDAGRRPRVDHVQPCAAEPAGAQLWGVEHV
jgi:hypothetical protein